MWPELDLEVQQFKAIFAFEINKHFSYHIILRFLNRVLKLQYSAFAAIFISSFTFAVNMIVVIVFTACQEQLCGGDNLNLRMECPSQPRLFGRGQEKCDTGTLGEETTQKKSKCERLFIVFNVHFLPFLILSNNNYHSLLPVT